MPAHFGQGASRGPSESTQGCGGVGVGNMCAQVSSKGGNLSPAEGKPLPLCELVRARPSICEPCEAVLALRGRPKYRATGSKMNSPPSPLPHQCWYPKAPRCDIPPPVCYAFLSSEPLTFILNWSQRQNWGAFRGGEAERGTALIPG